MFGSNYGRERLLHCVNNHISHLILTVTHYYCHQLVTGNHLLLNVTSYHQQPPATDSHQTHWHCYWECGTDRHIDSQAEGQTEVKVVSK